MGLLPGPQDIMAGLQLLDRAKSAFPGYEEETIVAVHGNPLSKISDLFNQAIAIAFGQTQNVILEKLSPTPFFADAQFDLMNKSVTVTLRYMFNGMLSQVIGGPRLVERFFTEMPADNLKVGKENNAWFTAVIALKGSDDLKNALDNTNVVAWGDQADIQAGKPLQYNNLPPLDGGSRGTFLEKLVLSALGGDCSIRDAWSSIRNKTMRTKPCDTGASGSSNSSSMTGTITGLTSDIYNTLTTATSTSDPSQQMPSSILDIYTSLLSTGGNTSSLSSGG